MPNLLIEDQDYPDEVDGIHRAETLITADKLHKRLWYLTAEYIHKKEATLAIVISLLILISRCMIVLVAQNEHKVKQ